MENVKHLVHHDKGRTLTVILNKLNELGYKTEWKVLNALDYGVPQNRNKSICKVGVRPGTEHLSRVYKQPDRIYCVFGMHPTLPSQETSGRYWILLANNRVRKLTLNECYRIMGFPENFKRPSSIGNNIDKSVIRFVYL